VYDVKIYELRDSISDFIVMIHQLHHVFINVENEKLKLMPKKIRLHGLTFYLK
jgi:hypothetical protein